MKNYKVILLLIGFITICSINYHIKKDLVDTPVDILSFDPSLVRTGFGDGRFYGSGNLVIGRSSCIYSENFIGSIIIGDSCFMDKSNKDIVFEFYIDYEHPIFDTLPKGKELMTYLINVDVAIKQNPEQHNGNVESRIQFKNTILRYCGMEDKITNRVTVNREIKVDLMNFYDDADSLDMYNLKKIKEWMV